MTVLQVGSGRQGRGGRTIIHFYFKFVTIIITFIITILFTISNWSGAACRWQDGHFSLLHVNFKSTLKICIEPCSGGACRAPKDTWSRYSPLNVATGQTDHEGMDDNPSTRGCI